MYLSQDLAQSVYYEITQLSQNDLFGLAIQPSIALAHVAL